MTVHKLYVIKCNGCAMILPSTNTTEEMIVLDDRPDSVTEARHLAAECGWRHTKSGSDLCAVCQKIKRAPVKSGRLLSHIPHWGHRS